MTLLPNPFSVKNIQLIFTGTYLSKFRSKINYISYRVPFPFFLFPLSIRKLLKALILIGFLPYSYLNLDSDKYFLLKEKEY